MKLAEKLIKLTLAIAAVAGIAYLVVTYMDNIKAWLAKVCPCCASEAEVTEEAPEVEEPVAEEAPAVEEVVVEEGTPIAEEADFAE